MRQFSVLLSVRTFPKLTFKSRIYYQQSGRFGRTYNDCSTIGVDELFTLWIYAKLGRL